MEENWKSALNTIVALFVAYLKSNKFYDIRNKEVRVRSPETEPRPQVAQPANPDNQGRSHTCASHAVGKAIVEIIDNFGLDCAQDEIIETLIKRIQPKKKAAYISDFNKLLIPVKVWDKQDKQIHSVEVCLLVQPVDFVTSNWNGPKGSLQMIKF